jgi:GDP-mannose 6-dehydrogenase
MTVQIAVFGLGYVGAVTAAGMASLGHTVIGVDRDPNKVSRIRAGKAPFFEPGLDELIRSTCAAGFLNATLSAEEAISDAEIALICVGTPSEGNGNQGLEQVRRVLEEITPGLLRRTKPLIIAMRSTVFPGTLEDIVVPKLCSTHGVSVVCNPEFLREGEAVKDFMEPSLLVVGGNDRATVEQVAALYSGINVPPSLVSLRTAEMIKYASNAFHAAKISFANEIGTLCQSIGVPAQEVMATLCKDTKLNISPAYLKPGFAYGGSCLPKDLRALNYRAASMDLKLPMLMNILESNRQHLNRAVRTVLDLDSQRLGFVGLAFKENTDDLRESPVVVLLEQLGGKQCEMRVWDPHIELEDLYGSNRDYLLQAIPHIEQLFCRTLEDLLRWATHIVISHSLPPEVRTRIQASGRPVLDLSEIS